MTGLRGKREDAWQNERNALRAALSDTIRMLDAVRYTAGFGKGQLARLEAARSALKAEGGE